MALMYRLINYIWEWPYVKPRISAEEWQPIEPNAFVYPADRVYKIEFRDSNMPIPDEIEEMENEPGSAKETKDEYTEIMPTIPDMGRVEYSTGNPPFVLPGGIEV